MANIVGLTLVLGGALLAWSVGGAFWAIWRGVTALLLVFIGAITLLIAFSERSARRQYQAATQDDFQDAPATETSRETEA